MTARILGSGGLDKARRCAVECGTGSTRVGGMVYGAGMTLTVFHTSVTLNGFLADEDDSLSWLFAVPGADDTENAMESFMATVGAFVMGAATYEWVLRFEEDERPGMWAQTYGALPCFVVTHRELAVPAGANIHFVQGDVASFWPRVTDAAGAAGVWLVGGGQPVGSSSPRGGSRRKKG